MGKTTKKQAMNIQDEKERIKVLLDATPLACRLMRRLDDGKFELFECNEESVKLFNFKDKQELIDRYFETYPEYQPDGSNSIEKGQQNFEKAYVEGRCVIDFHFQTTDGVLFPTEITLVRVKYLDDYVVAGYTRDMREHNKMMECIEKRDNLLNVINRVAVLLLAVANEKKFEESLVKGMELIGQCLGADCIQIWANETHDDTLRFVLKYKWLSEIGHQVLPVAIGTTIPYSAKWNESLLNSECINGPIAELSREWHELSNNLGIKSTIAIPLFYRDTFWGVFCVDDLNRDRQFTESEINILNSAGLMLVNAINRNEHADQIREAHKRTQLLLDTTPLAVHFWDKNLNLFDCNEESVRLFKMKDKQDYITRFKESSLEYQPSGFPSRDMAYAYINRAFDEGSCVFEWVHRASDGTQIPSEVTLVRVAYKEGYAVAGYVRDLREYKRMMQDIRESAVKLEEALNETQRANDAKSDFLASMSHEMRTPLNAIIGLSGLSLENTELDEETCSNLEKIYSAGEMLLAIVNDILDISKIEAGRMVLVEEDYDVPSLINDTVTQNVLRIGEKPIELKLDIGEDMFSRLYGDELRIKQIMNNLLSNAIKYTDEGTVELSVHCAQDNDHDNNRVWVTIKVSDTGIGIRPEDIGTLFIDYHQLDLKSNRKTEGTGLGLPIAKNLAEMMQGSIDVESEYGKGSVFTVKIAQKFVSDVHIGQEVVKSLQNFRYSDDKRWRNTRFKRISLPYARVLVVDDNLTNLEVAKGFLKPYGMQIDCVSSGQQAIDAIRDEKALYNAVFMDHMMPGMDGIEATRIIREEIGTEYAKNVPIIALTANAIAGNEAMFLKKGFNAFIPKPIEIARLDGVIRQWVKDKNHEKLLSEQPNDLNRQIKRSNIDRRSGIDYRVLGMGIKNLNIDKGIERFGGNEDTYFDILRAFVTNTAPLLESIKDVSIDDIAIYAITVHGIKGSARSIGADTLADISEKLEQAAKARDFDFIYIHNPLLLKLAEQLISEINELIMRASPGATKPKKEKPDMDVLKKLLDACKRFDTDEIDLLIKELDTYEYESDNDLIDWLLKNANKYNFTEIKERLLALFDREEVTE